MLLLLEVGDFVQCTEFLQLSPYVYTTVPLVKFLKLCSQLKLEQSRWITDPIANFLIFVFIEFPRPVTEETALIFWVLGIPSILFEIFIQFCVVVMIVLLCQYVGNIELVVLGI